MEQKWKYNPFFTFITSMHVEAFLPVQFPDQFENPGLIELRRLWNEPRSRGRVRRQSQNSYCRETSWVETDVNRRVSCPGCMAGTPKHPNSIPTIFYELGETHAGERCLFRMDLYNFLSFCKKKSYHSYSSSTVDSINNTNAILLVTHERYWYVESRDLAQSVSSSSFSK